MVDWRLIPASLGFREFNPCHHPPGSSEGGQFCSTGSTEHTAIGLFNRGGEIVIRDLKLESPTRVMHLDLFGADALIAKSAKRFRYEHGEVVWDDVPSDDDLFAVENEFEDMGWRVKGHAELVGGVIPRPKPMRMH